MRLISFLLLFSFIGLNAQGQGFTDQEYTTDSSFADNVYWKRMQQAPLAIKPYFDIQIQREIKRILQDRRTPEILGKYLFYKDSIAQIFSEFGIPQELQIIAFSNTFLKENYFSEIGATGIWPLSYSIGKKYGLVINSFVDERQNLFASTRAAAQSIADLHTIYGDWYFTIAAFRSGPVEINKAVRMAGGTLDYFVTEPYIKYEYRSDFSKFMAAVYVIYNYSFHNIAVTPYAMPILDTVCTPRTFSFSELALATKTPISLLKKLNYQYKKQIVPHKPFHHCFVLPKSKAANFGAYILKLQQEEEAKRIADSTERAKGYIEKFRPDSTGYQVIVLDGKLTVIDSAGNVIDPDIPIVTEKPKEASATGNRWVFYTVKSGDALLLLSDIFDVSLTDVKRWNKLRGNTIRKGQRLKFLVPANKYSKYSSINRMSSAQKQKVRRKD